MNIRIRYQYVVAKGIHMKQIKKNSYIIKYILFALIVIVIFLGLYLNLLHKNSEEDLASALEKNELLIDSTIDETLAYTLISKEGVYEYGDFFVVFKRISKDWQRIYENDFRDLMPWKLEVADIDGDDKKEILIAVQKTTTYDKEMKNRMFIFNYEDGILAKKWTGSQIAGMWREFYPMDLLSLAGDELVFIEKAEGDTERISIYSWFDFGFFRIADSEEYQQIQNLTMVGENLLEITYYEEEEEINLILTAVDGKLIPKEELSKRTD
jgi:hypothetical protein